MGADEPAHRSALVVLGSHRSGTSALARVLGLSGGRLPDDPLDPNVYNERGYWESQAVVAFNDEVLDAYDTSWDDVFGGQPRRHLSNFDRVFRQRAGELIEASFGGAEPIVLKDPRINLLVGFWDAALRLADYKPMYVVAVRNPLEVAASLLNRDRMAIGQGLLLWLDQMLAVERDTCEARRVFVALDDLLEDFERCLDRIEEAWGRPLPRRTAAAHTTIAQFLAPQLRHHKRAGPAPNGRSPVQEMAATAYAWFQDACRSTGKTDGATLDALRRRLADYREVLEPVTVTNRTKLKESIRHTGNLEQAHGGLTTMLQAAEASAAALQQEAATLRASIHDHEGVAERLVAAEERGQELAHQLKSAADTQRDAAEQLALSQGREQELERLLASATEAQQDAATQLALNQGRQQELERLLASATEAQQDVAERLASNQNREQELERLLASTEAQQEELAGRLASAEARAQDLDDQQAAATNQGEALAGPDGTEADLEALEARYRVLSEELRRVQSAFEQARVENRTLKARLESEAKSAETRAREREDSWIAERERDAAAADELQARHADALAGLRERHVQELEQQTRLFTANEQVIHARMDRLGTDRASDQLEIERLRAERAAILRSTSWRLAAFPRRLVTAIRRD